MLSALSAFMVPQGVSDRLRPAMGSLLWPVAQPARSLGGWVSGRDGPSVPTDARPADAIVAENLELKQTIARMQYDLDDYRRRDAERAKMGELRDLCRPATVIGSERVREVLTLGSGSLSGLADRMPVLYQRDLVGVLRNVGVANANVLLTTDPQSRIRVHFATFRRVAGAATAPAAAGAEARLEFVPLRLEPTLVVGKGEGKMLITNIPASEAEKAQLTEGVWVVVDDPELPRAVQGLRIGVVKRIVKVEKLMTEIEVRPELDLMALKEVMVLVKDR